MIRKSFFLILVFALLSVPVFLMAHAFTHFAQVDALDITEAEYDDDADRDEICLDCLAFTALSIILIVSGLFLSHSAQRQRWFSLANGHHLDNDSFPYYSRAPPCQFLII